ncbi:MAG: MFS transporter [Pseudomonadota bacterium]
MSVATLLGNRNFLGLITANTVLGSAFPIQLVLGGLTGLMLAPSAALATLPASLQTLAGLLAAAPVSLLMGRLGRRAGFALGAGLTGLGAVAAVRALYTADFVLLCAAHLLFGAGWAAFQYFRFAAAEVVARDWRPVAISLMLSSLLVAALVGPQVFIGARDLLAPIPFAGAYAAVGGIALLGVLPLALVRMPRPARPLRTPRTAGRLAALSALRRPPVRRAVSMAAVSQGVMVFLMVPTPIAILACGFSEDMASDVIRWHIVAMFAPSFFTGFLIKRFGAERIAAAGLVLLIAAAGSAAHGITALHFYGALIVLGVGWNFGFISATSMLEAAITEEEKAAVQGANDTLIALVATLAAFASGPVISGAGWGALPLLSGAIVAVALGVFLMGRPRAARA